MRKWTKYPSLTYHVEFEEEIILNNTLVSTINTNDCILSKVGD